MRGRSCEYVSLVGMEGTWEKQQEVKLKRQNLDLTEKRCYDGRCIEAPYTHVYMYITVLITLCSVV